MEFSDSSNGCGSKAETAVRGWPQANAQASSDRNRNFKTRRSLQFGRARAEIKQCAVAFQWFSKLSAPLPQESDMLGELPVRRSNSRLPCQDVLGKQLRHLLFKDKV
jgi:hypothetical protein